MSRASEILAKINPQDEAGNDFSMRVALKSVVDTKRLNLLNKEARTLVSAVIPDIIEKDITLTVDGDKKHIRVNVANVPTSLFDKLEAALKDLAN